MKPGERENKMEKENQKKNQKTQKKSNAKEGVSNSSLSSTKSTSFQKDSSSSEKIDKVKKSKTIKKRFQIPKIKSQKKPLPSKGEEALQKELSEVKKSYLYLQSEFANFKRTSEKQTISSIEYANTEFIQDLLNTVLNDFNRALEQPFSNKNLDEFRKGIEMIHQKFLRYLKEKGVEEISPQKGDIFNPYIHEVLSTQENKEVPENTILHICKKGYKLKEKLIQPAQVIVSQ